MWERIYAHAVLLIFASTILKAYCKGNGSLTFVIDDTGSMGDDIRQVRRSVDRISNTVLNEKSIQISNMVLVTFNDPDAKVRTVTQDRRTFQRILDAVPVYGGGDCWEPSMKGLLLALEKSNRDSYIYVFTDAAAKDYWDGRYVKAMCQKKQSQIVFVLTGKCSGYGYPTESFDVFFDVAHACSGQAFFVPKKDVEQVLRTIEESIRGNKTVITTTIVPAGKTKKIPFTVDEHTDYAIVSVSGENVELDIKGPSSFNLERIMWNNNGKVVKLSNTKPATYVATVMGHSRTSVVIVGRTDFFFSHGFSQQKPKSQGDTSLQPIAESKVHLSIFVTDDHQSVQIVSAQILDMNEKPIDVPLPLTKISKDFYVTKLLVAPSQRFKVAVNGIVRATGKPIKRIGKIPITPQEPPKKLPDNTRPKVVIAEGKAIEIEYNSTMKLTCNVVAFPEPNIVWANMKGQVMPSKMSLKEYPYNYISYMDISYASKDDRYKCYAANKVGRDETTIDVKVKEPFIVKSTPSKITKFTYGTEGTINCDITSHLPLDIHWYYANERTGETRQITNSYIYEISESGTRLKIKKMDLNLVGRYECKFSLKNKNNVQKAYLTRVEIDGLIAPKVQVPTYVNVTRGKTAVFECKVVTGAPAPNITWLFGGKSGSSFTPIGSESVLRITNVEDKHEGQYKCVARNVVDKDEHISTLFVQDLPKITTSSFTIYQATEGDALMRIPCIAAGVPKPVINWKLSGRYITPGKKYSIEDGTLIIRGPAVSDTNSYTCEAKNEVGVVSATFKTYIRQLPKISGVATKNVREGTPASIECMIVKGEPKPNITWQFMSEAASNIVPIVGSKTTLHIPNAAKTHTGRYKCVARNDVGSDEHITSLIVEFAPAITTNSSTIEGIEGDLGLRIPCDVVGVPKPVITWKLKGTSITSDAKYTIEDGALVIMNPTEKDTSSYTCEAKNNIGSVSVTFQAKVNKYPKNFGSEHNIYLKQGETRKLECEPYSSKSQSVTWFITRKASSLSTTTPRPEWSESSTASSKDASSTPRTITQYADKKEYIQITNASFSDHDGNYTCRVSDKHGNTQTYTYVVDVGNAPEFVTDSNLISNWRGETKDITEICYVNETTKPIPVVQWMFNGKKLFDISSAGVGHYTCNVSNVHGFALKKFDVKSSACLITRDIRDMPYMPLVLNDEGNWHTFQTTEHFMIIEEEEKITLSCPSPKETSNTFKKFPKRKTLEAFCIKENTFMVEHQTFSLSELQCSNNIQPSVIRNKVKCSTETSELISVGYNVPGFLKAYEVCFDHKINLPLYTRVIMTEHNKKSPSADYDWYTYPGIGSEKTKRGFTCKDTSSSCCYSKSQLVHAIDFNDGPAKKSTFIDPVNVIPVWLPCNTSKWSWENVNDQVRTQLPVYNELVVWSGTHTVQEKNGASVPRYLWKVVRLDDDEVMAIVYVNDPKPTESDIKCKTPDVCRKYEDWMVSDNSVYCCSLPDFLKAFDIHVPSIGESMDAVLDEIEST